jgi:uncharacterized protein (DUF58 family)
VTKDAASDGAATDGLVTLLRTVRRLELAARRNAAGWLAGDYLTAVRGRGLIFHESRKYLPGEPARHIDWNVTARLGEPYVKVHLEERRRDVIVAVDVSPSMHTGFGERSKIEHAVELAATLAVSAVDAGDRLGHLLFADRVLDESRPRGGRTQLFRVLRALVEGCRPGSGQPGSGQPGSGQPGSSPGSPPVAESDPRVAIHALERHRRGRFVVFLISDFLDRDVPDDLRYLRPRHDVSLLHVYDPLELSPAPIVLRGVAPEGGARGSVRPGEAGELAAVEGELRRAAARHRIAVGSFPTDLPARSGLDRFFHRKRRLLGARSG